MSILLYTLYVHGISIPPPSTHFFITEWVSTAWSEMSKKKDMINRSFKKCDITLALDGTENADLNIEGLKDYEMPPAEEAHEFQLQSESSSCEKEQEDILFYFILSVLRF